MCSCQTAGHEKQADSGAEKMPGAQAEPFPVPQDKRADQARQKEQAKEEKGQCRAKREKKKKEQRSEKKSGGSSPLFFFLAIRRFAAEQAAELFYGQ